MGQKYDKLGSVSDVKNANAFTGTATKLNTDWLNNAYNMVWGSGSGGNSGLMGLLNSNNPEAGFNWFMNNAPGLANVGLATTSPLVQALNTQANYQAGQAVGDVAAQYGGPQNSYYSGAAANAMLDSAANVRNQFLNQALGAQTNIAGGLLNTGLQLAPGAFNQSYANALNTYNLAGNLGSQALGNLTSYGAPEWWQPTYEKRGGGLGGFFSGALGGGAGGATIGSEIGSIGGPMGALFGAGLGGLAGLFG